MSPPLSTETLIRSNTKTEYYQASTLFQHHIHVTVQLKVKKKQRACNSLPFQLKLYYLTQLSRLVLTLGGGGSARHFPRQCFLFIFILYLYLYTLNKTFIRCKYSKFYLKNTKKQSHRHTKFISSIVEFQSIR